MGANSSSCVVRIQLHRGRNVRVLAWRASEDDSASSVFYDMVLEHGQEKKIESPPKASHSAAKGLRVALDLGEGDKRLLSVSNGATVFLKEYNKEVLLRICGEGELTWKNMEYTNGSAIFEEVEDKGISLEATQSSTQNASTANGSQVRQDPAQPKTTSAKKSEVREDPAPVRRPKTIVGGNRSECTVRVQLTRTQSVHVLAWRASDEDSASSVFCSVTVEHGTERRIESPPKNSHNAAQGLRLAVDIGGGDRRLVAVPNGGTLFVRLYDQEVFLRLCRAEECFWEMLDYTDGGWLFDQRSGTRSGSHFIGNAREQATLVPATPSASQQATDLSAAGTPHLSTNADTSAAGSTTSGNVSSSTKENIALCQDSGAIQSSANEAAACVPESATDDSIFFHETMCPISHETMVDPVLASDGFTYERECIEEWWRRRGTISPMTGQKLENTKLQPNLAIRAIIESSKTEDCNPSIEDQSVSTTEGFYDKVFLQLCEMFEHLTLEEIRAECSTLEASGVHDLDVCVRRLMQLQDGEQEIGGVSMDPVCCLGAGADKAPLIRDPLDPALQTPESWSMETEMIFIELLTELNMHPVRARKAIEIGLADDIADAVEWIEKHQDDPDLDTPMETLREREAIAIAEDVLAVATVPVNYRLDCFNALHQLLGRIINDPESERVRKVRIRNPKFKERIGRFPPAVRFLKSVGFVKGEYWISGHEKEPALEFKLPVDSDNPMSQRFLKAYSFIDEMVKFPDEWISVVAEASPEVQSQWVTQAEAEAESTSNINDVTELVNQRSTNSSGGPPRAYLAELHERRVKDPRKFEEAMRAAGKQPNRVVVNVKKPTEAQPHGASSSSRSSSDSGGQVPYRNLAERLGKRSANLQDLENIRYEDAIAGMPQYAKEYDEAKGSSTKYTGLISRSYDPQYLGRRAVDETNIFRATEKKPPVKWSQALCDIAQKHAQQMAKGEMPFSHKGFDERVRQYPFPHMSAAENLAWNSGMYDCAGQAVKGWIKSPGHRKNLLGAFDLCGVGAAQNGGQFFFTQLFARTYGPLA